MRMDTPPLTMSHAMDAHGRITVMPWVMPLMESQWSIMGHAVVEP